MLIGYCTLYIVMLEYVQLVTSPPLSCRRSHFMRMPAVVPSNVQLVTVSPSSPSPVCPPIERPCPCLKVQLVTVMSEQTVLPGFATTLSSPVSIVQFWISQWLPPMSMPSVLGEMLELLDV